MNDKVLFKIAPLELLTYFLRILSVITIGLCIYYIQINPLVFILLSLIAGGILFLSRTSRIILTDRYLFIEHKSIIPFMSRRNRIDISDIVQIGFNKEFKPIARYLLPEFHLFPTNDNEIILRLKNNVEISQTQIGTKKQFLELLKKLTELYEIKTTNC